MSPGEMSLGKMPSENNTPENYRTKNYAKGKLSPENWLHRKSTSPPENFPSENCLTTSPEVFCDFFFFFFFEL